MLLLKNENNLTLSKGDAIDKESIANEKLTHAFKDYDSKTI